MGHDVSELAAQDNLGGVSIEELDGGYLVLWTEATLRTKQRGHMRDGATAVGLAYTDISYKSCRAMRAELPTAMELIVDILKRKRVHDQRDPSPEPA